MPRAGRHYPSRTASAAAVLELRPLSIHARVVFPSVCSFASRPPPRGPPPPPREPSAPAPRARCGAPQPQPHALRAPPRGWSCRRRRWRRSLRLCCDAWAGTQRRRGAPIALRHFGRTHAPGGAPPPRSHSLGVERVHPRRAWRRSTPAFCARATGVALHQPTPHCTPCSSSLGPGSARCGLWRARPEVHLLRGV